MVEFSSNMYTLKILFFEFLSYKLIFYIQNMYFILGGM